MNEVQEIIMGVPSYRETLQEIGRQLASRKTILRKRIIKIISPPLIVFVGLTIVESFFRGDLEGIFQQAMRGDSPTASTPFYYSAGLILGPLILSLVYYYVMSFIFSIEKRIWVDSFFDGKNLSPEESWRIARRLFWSSIRLQVEAGVRYVLPAVIVFISIVFVYGWFGPGLGGTSGENTLETAIFLVVFAALICVGVYLYYVPIILRYLPFLFLDGIGTSGFSYRQLFVDMRRMNKIESKKTHVRALVVQIAEDATVTIISGVTGTMHAGAAQFGVVGKVMGGVTRMIAEEATKQTSSVSKVVAYYLLYRFVRQQIFSKPQHVNEFLYLR